MVIKCAEFEVSLPEIFGLFHLKDQNSANQSRSKWILGVEDVLGVRTRLKN